MERKIGEIFEYKGKYYRVVESKLNLCYPYCAFSYSILVSKVRLFFKKK